MHKFTFTKHISLKEPKGIKLASIVLESLCTLIYHFSPVQALMYQHRDSILSGVWLDNNNNNNNNTLFTHVSPRS